MTEQQVHRRLAAILAADVVGYSALMQRAEVATYAEFERLKRRDRATLRAKDCTEGERRAIREAEPPADAAVFDREATG